MMDARQKSMWAAAGVGTVGALSFAWYRTRIYMRDATVESLNTDYKYDEMVGRVKTVAAFVGKDVRLPTARQFAVAMVPLLGTNTPYTAIEDILAKGRRSVYWPPKFKQGGVPEAFEPYVLAAFRGAYYTPEDATNAEMATAAAKGLVDAIIGGGKKKGGKKKGKK